MKKNVLILHQRRGEGAINTPPPVQSLPNHQNPKTDLLGPCAQALRSAVEGQIAVVGNVPHLLFARGPSAIVGRVAAIVITAFQGVLGRRAWPRIGDEVGKVVPSLADSPADSAVILEALAGFRFAAFQHGRPNPVLWRSATVAGSAVGDLACEGAAPATDCRSLPRQVAMSNALGVPTITPTEPHDFGRAALRKSVGNLNHCQRSDLASGEISEVVFGDHLKPAMGVTL